jgi:hypothetical protein
VYDLFNLIDEYHCPECGTVIESHLLSCDDHVGNAPELFTHEAVDTQAEKGD